MGHSGLDLSTSLVNVFGPGESGKSNFIKHLLAKPPYSRHFVFDPMKEYDPEDYVVYRPDNLDYDGGNDELNAVLDEMTSLPVPARPKYIVVDEAANFLPGGNKSIGPKASELAYHNTHIAPGMTLITSNRHPNDLNPSIREMYDHMFVFGARGRNAKRTLDNMAEGLSEAVEQLGEYEFVHVDPQGEITTFEPVRDMGSYERI